MQVSAIILFTLTGIIVLAIGLVICYLLGKILCKIFRMDDLSADKFVYTCTGVLVLTILFLCFMLGAFVFSNLK